MGRGLGVAIALVWSCLCVSCENANDAKPTATGSVSQIPVMFSLVNADSWSIDVTNCASGFALTGAAGATAQLFLADQGCLAVLKSFVWRGKTWTPTVPGGCCATPDPVIFTNNTETQRSLSVSVLENLPSPLTVGARARFVFREILHGQDVQLLTSGIAGQLASQSPIPANDAPNLDIFKTDLISFDQNRVGTFRFQLECRADVTVGNTVCPTATGQAQDFTVMRAALVRDSGVEPDWNGAQAAFDAAATEGRVVNIDLANLVAPSGSPAYRGGFFVDLVGPGDVTAFPEDNRRMLLLVEWWSPTANERSYGYFQIRFAD